MLQNLSTALSLNFWSEHMDMSQAGETDHGRIRLNYCAVPENIHTPYRLGLEFPGGGGSLRPDHLIKVMYQVQLEFPEGLGHPWNNSLPMGSLRYGYFMELDT